MKNRLLLIICMFYSISLFSQEKMYIHKSDKMTLGALLTMTDSVYFTENETIANFRIGDTLAYYPITEIDSVTFGPNSNTIYIIYNGTDVTVINPLAFEGVAVAVEGSDVTVNATTQVQDINFDLSGTTTDGSFKIYTAKRYNLILHGVNITNPDGPAINVQSEKKTSVMLVDGTSNTLTDGLTYATPPNGEDQKGAFFSEAQLIFSGSGSLTINAYGSVQHGLSSDNVIEINGGVIAVSRAAKDGIHASNGFLMTAGTVYVTSSGDGIDAETANIEISGGNITTSNNSDDVKGIACDSTMLISGGIINITVTGDQSKGLKSKQAMTLSGGAITIFNSGDAVLEASGSGYDPSYCTAIKSDVDITISGADITIIATGKAGKGVSSDTSIIMTAGNLEVTASGNGATYTNTSGQADAYVSTCLSADVNIEIIGGSVTTSSSGTGGKGFSSDGSLIIGNTDSSPTIQVTTTGNRILISGSGQNANYAEAKAVKSDAAVVINNGNITIASADDGIKSETSVSISNATITITNSTEGIEAPAITFNSGNTHIKSSDDCLNATHGNGGEQDDNSLLTIAGGYVMVNTTGGDGLDSNGDVLVSGGTIIVHGPPSSPEVGIDYNGTFNMNGGFMVASGTNSNMTQAPSNSSTQYCVKAVSNQSISSSTLFHIQDASANDVVTFQPMRNYYSIVFSSSALQNGSTYSIYTGGSYSGGTVTDGYYSGGTYTAGTFKKSFTISSKITNVTF